MGFGESPSWWGVVPQVGGGPTRACLQLPVTTAPIAPGRCPHSQASKAGGPAEG